MGKTLEAEAAIRVVDGAIQITLFCGNDSLAPNPVMELFESCRPKRNHIVLWYSGSGYGSWCGNFVNLSQIKGQRKVKPYKGRKE
jgi:hypothetical protein